MKIWLAIVLGSIASLAVLWSTSVPLGIPGEWEWDRAKSEPDMAWNIGGGIVAAGLFLGFVLQGRRRLEILEARSKRGIEFVAWLVGLVAISFAWIWIVQEIAPLKNRLGKSPFVLYYPSSSGYFTRARYEQPLTSDLLASYEQLMLEGDVLHTGTHPPGLFLVFQGLIAICEKRGALSAMLDATQPASFRDACNVIAGNSMRGKIPLAFLELDRRVLWLATILVMLSASLTVIPLFGLLCRHCSLATAWICAAIWPAIPAVAVFIPKSDAAFPLLAATLMWFWLTAWDWRSLTLALLAGLVMWCGLMCSLAFLPVVLAAGMMTVGSSILRPMSAVAPFVANEKEVHQPPRVGIRRWSCVALACAGFAVPTFMLWFFTNLNMLNVWMLNYRNHAGFYGQYARTYWMWLLVNPLELSFAAGWPLTLLAILGGSTLFNRLRGRSTIVLSQKMMMEIGSIVCVWGLLWLTGKNSGETARLWILFLPWIVWLASVQIGSMALATPNIEVRDRQAMFLLAMQLAVCLLTVARVNGFHSDAS